MNAKNFDGYVLYKFLLKNNCLYSFMNNFSNYCQNPQCSRLMEWKKKFDKDKDFIGLLNTIGNINRAFIWSETKEGTDYWSKLHVNFFEYKGKAILEWKKIHH